MTQEDKQLLIKDLCGRLPYGVYVDIYSWQKDSPKLLVECVPGYVGEEVVLKKLAGRHSIKEVKPYLRPMSSMTEEERLEYEKRSNGDHEQCYELRANGCDRLEILEQDAYTAAFDLEWLNENHFDYRGLIPKGLALEAPEGMYKVE